MRKRLIREAIEFFVLMGIAFALLIMTGCSSAWKLREPCEWDAGKMKVTQQIMLYDRTYQEIERCVDYKPYFEFERQQHERDVAEIKRKK